MPVAVASFLVPRNGNSWYLIEDKYLKGSLRIVLDVNERDLIHASSLKHGMLVLQQDDGLIYQLGEDLMTWIEWEGLRGADGKDGAAGKDGVDGPAGKDGAQGIQGVQGLQGVPGEKGEKGETGPAGGGGSGAGSAGLFVTNIVGGNTSKTFVAGTIPANRVVDSAAIDTASAVTITVQAEGGSSFYSPQIRMNVDPNSPADTGVVAAVALASGANERLFTGTATLDLTSLIPAGETKPITIWADTGLFATINVTRAAGGPAVKTAVFGAYPGAQTALKAGDAILVTGTVPNAATQVDAVISTGMVNGSAANTTTTGGSIGALDSAGVGFRNFTIRVVASTATGGAQTATVRARNSLGTYGADFVTTTTVAMDHVLPTIGAFAVTYPSGLNALDTGTVATVAATVTNYTGITYSSSDGGLAISTPTAYSASKTATYTGNGYTDSGTNYTITATKASNGSSVSSSTLVRIAAARPTAVIAIAGNPTRLVSTATGNSYVVTLNASQNLSVAPAVVIDSDGGTLSAFTGSNKSWTATLTIRDADVRGLHSFTATLTNAAKVTGTTISAGSSYNIGGFSLRTLTVGAFEQVVALPTVIGDPTKVVVNYAGSTGGMAYKAGDLAQAKNAFSIVDATYNPAGSPRKYSNYVFNAKGAFLFLNDEGFANSNTSGTLQIEILESA